MDRVRLYDRAYELAASGEHIDCITIVTALIAEGFTDAEEALRSEMIRADLRKICRQHWKHDTPQPADPILRASSAPTGNP